MERKPPEIGHPFFDTLLGIAWGVLFAINLLSVSAFADLMVALGAAATTVLTTLRIYEHLAGETVSTTLTNGAEDTVNEGS